MHGTATYYVHCIPPEFPNITVETHTDAVSDGLLLMTPSVRPIRQVVSGHRRQQRRAALGDAGPNVARARTSGATPTAATPFPSAAPTATKPR